MLDVFPAVPPDGKFDPDLLCQVGAQIWAQIAVPAELTATLTKAGVQPPQPIFVPALIDTGASLTAVDLEVLEKLGLKPTGQIVLATPSDPEAIVGLYAVSFTFPQARDSDATVDPIAVAGCNLKPQGVHALLGRDLLGGMLMVYNGPGGFFTLAF